MRSVLLLLCLVLSGCGLPDRPLDRVQLVPSAWEILSVDGSALDEGSRRTLAIDDNNAARLWLGCGLIYLQYDSDTDGSALGFTEVRVDDACAGSSDQTTVAVRQALDAVEEWRVVSDTSIEMLDGDGRPVLALRTGPIPSPATPDAT
jgi:hypothetical protein